MKRSSIKSTDQGFSLLELLICLGIASIIIMASITSFLDGARWYYRSLLNQEGINTTSVVMEVIGRDIENSGGGSIRSWMAIWVENTEGVNNCPARAPLGACNGADRITLAYTPVPTRECGIVSSVNATTVVLDSTPVCCLNAAPVEVMMVMNNNWMQRRVNGFDAATCTLNLVDGPMSPNDRGGLPNWAGGVVSVIRVGTFYADLERSHLRYFEDANANNVIDAGEDVLIADLIFQFQVGLGYDFRPLDGFISETPVNADEILFNSPGESLGAGYFLNAIPLNFTSVIIGMATGGKSSEQQNIGVTGAILDGANIAKPGWEINRYQARFLPKHGLYY